jgi:hypothetical protein
VEFVVNSMGLQVANTAVQIQQAVVNLADQWHLVGRAVAMLLDGANVVAAWGADPGINVVCKGDQREAVRVRPATQSCQAMSNPSKALEWQFWGWFVQGQGTEETACKALGEGQSEPLTATVGGWHRVAATQTTGSDVKIRTIGRNVARAIDVREASPEFET